MAISPGTFQNGNKSGTVTAAKDKALAVRTTSISTDMKAAHQSSQSKKSELAEQLNEETKQKYVKGLLY